MITTLLFLLTIALGASASAPDPPSNVLLQRISDKGVRLEFSASSSVAVDGYLAEFDAVSDFSSSAYLSQFVPAVHPVTVSKWSSGPIVYARISAHSPSGGYGTSAISSPAFIDLNESVPDVDKGWLEPPRVFYIIGGVFGLVFTCFFIWKIRSCIKRRAMGPNYSHPTGSEQEADAKDTLELVTHENGNGRSANGVGRASSDDLRLEEGIDDEEEPIAPLTVGRSAQTGLFDSVWFQQQWQSIMRTHTVQADVIEHQYFDTDILERLVERSGYTLIASGQPQTGLLKLYFFCDFSENPREKKKHVVLGEVVVNIGTHHLTGQFKSETADAKTMKSFTKAFEAAFSSIIQQPNSKIF